MDGLAELSASEAARLVAAAEVSPSELLDAALARIQRLDGTLHAFEVVLADRAREEARRLTEEARTGALRGPLHGVPLAIKDIVDVAGVPTTASSAVRRGSVQP